MEVKKVKIDELKPHPKNPRIHPDSAIEKLERSIREFGWTNPVLVSRDGYILAGHARVKAAKKAGIEEVPVIYLELEGAKAEAYMIADNRLQEETKWDNEILEKLIKDLSEIDFDLKLTGFDKGEIDDILDDLLYKDNFKVDLEDLIEPRIKRGEVWQLGRHKVICGDSTSNEVWNKLLEDEKADLIITSPPYNIGKDYKSYDDKKEKEDYLDFIYKMGLVMKNHLKKGRFIGWNIGSLKETYPHHQVVELEKAGFEYYREIIWVKSGVPYPVFTATARKKKARYYKPNYKHELIYLFSNETNLENTQKIPCPACDGEGQTTVMEIPNTHETIVLLTNEGIEVGGDIDIRKKYKNDVWEISQSNATIDIPTIEKSGKVTKKAHPAPFPVEVPMALMGFLTTEGEFVVDPFLGVGSTIIAAEKSNRIAYGIELDEIYCEIAIQRWEEYTGEKAKKVI